VERPQATGHGPADAGARQLSVQIDTRTAIELPAAVYSAKDSCKSPTAKAGMTPKGMKEAG